MSSREIGLAKRSEIKRESKLCQIELVLDGLTGLSYIPESSARKNLVSGGGGVVPKKNS